MPAGYSIEIDAPDTEDPALQYTGGWDSWYIGDVVGFGSWVRKYWTPAAALSGYQRTTTGTFANDFYTGCMTGTRAAPAVAGAAAYTAIHCSRDTYNRTIYFATYDNIVLRFEFSAPLPSNRDRPDL